MLTNLLFFACTEPVKIPPTVVEPADSPVATTLQPLATNHASSLILQARITDDNSFAVSDELVTFQVGSDTFTTFTDAFGYASVELDTTETAVTGTVQWGEQKSKNDKSTYLADIKNIIPFFTISRPLVGPFSSATFAYGA